MDDTRPRAPLLDASEGNRLVRLLTPQTPEEEEFVREIRARMRLAYLRGAGPSLLDRLKEAGSED